MAIRLGPWKHVLLPLLLLFGALELRRSEGPLVQQVQALAFDLFQRSSPRAYDPATPVRIVDIDDASLERVGQWPWPRTRVAELVERLRGLGAASIALDMVFAEPDRTSPSRASGALAEQIAACLAPGAASLPDHDRILAEELARSRVVTGFALTHREMARAPALKASFAFTAADADADPAALVPRFSGAVTNLPLLEAAAAGNGHMNSDADRDGVTRRVPLVAGLGSKLVPSLALEALRVASGGRTYKLRLAGSGGEARFGAGLAITQVQIPPHFEVPTDAHGRIWVHYSGPEPSRFVPAWKVLDGSVARERVEGAVVFVGTSAAGLVDLRATPFEATAPGVAIHAEIAEQVLAGRFLVRPDWALGAEVCFTALLGGLLIALLRRVGSVGCALIGSGAVGAALALSWLAFVRWQILLDPAFPALSVTAVFGCGVLLNYRDSENHRRRVRRAFSRYLAPELVRRLAADPSRLVLGGEIRDMTILFSDVRGFTTFSERLAPEDLTRLMNRFLTPMTEEILARHGTIDKYIGDCVMAFWNAPLEDPDHARHGCEAALAMLRRLHSVNASLERAAAAEGWLFAPLHIGIGLNSGRCCVGNMGSDQRFDYSVLSDEVNLASRLEGQSKTYGVDVLIGPATRAGAPEFAVLELDLLRVKGRSQPARIYALLGDPALAASAEFRELVAQHEALLKAYRAREWSEAQERIEACLALPFPLEPLYEVFLQRIRGFVENDPGPGWDGVYTATAK